MGENDQTQDMPPDMPIPEFKPLKKQPGRVGTTIGDYDVDAELGRGGMGVVYRARQKELNRLVALKMLTGHYGKEELDRFLAEAQTAAGLHHTNIVHIYEVGDFEGSPYFSMEFVEGGTLAERLKKALPTPRETAEILMPVARALHFAHQHGVVHRDMKPHNILIDPDGVPKVADFGIAKRMDNDHSLTRTGAVIGTPTYMAPEQAKGTSRDVGPAADVYSLGAILYEMLTGRPPFLPEESDTPLAIRVISEDTPSPAWHRPEIPREIEIICMKCLQKDPRDRYASAAAFAEDLRRYLDDEGILARPPSRIVKGIKWVRRNPWRFTVTVVLLLSALAGGQRLYQWEFYERSHVEHAAGLEYLNGALAPVLPLSEADTHRRAVTLQVTRRGRRGPVTKIEVLNPRGNPATIRRLLAEEAIPLYIEGLSAVQPYEEKAPECSTVEQIYDGNTIREITGRDRDSVVNWRIIYDRPVASAGVAPIIRARFTNLRGIEKGNSRNATLLEFERDASGRDLRVNFFNSAGQPALNGDGVFGYRLERDATGRLVQMTNLDREGKPAFNRAGFVGCKFVWDAVSGYPNRAEICDAEGVPALWNGTAAVVTDRDAAGNAIRVRRLGLGGQYAHRGVTDWVVQEIPRNERGEILARKYLRLDDSGSLALLSEYGYRYDENGQPTEVSFSGVEKYRTVLRHDAKGTLLEELFYDGQGQPAVQKAGYSGRKIAYEHGPTGLRTVQTYLDGNGQPVYTKSGYRRLVMDYDTTGVIHRHALEGHDPARFGYYSYVGITDFDGQGRVQRGTIRYEDEKGQLVDAEKAELPFNEKEEEYDEEGRVILEWQFGWSEKHFGASVWRKDTSWHKSGALRHLVWQACNDKREPLEKVSNKHPARIEEDYDEQGNMERNFESDFDEAKVGFRSRERIYYRGKLERVVHRNSAGEILKDIRVCIVEVPPNAPGLLAGLHVGDQLLTANGEPRNSAFEWVSGEDFPGGFVEILRDGQRLKIDGLKPGKLGVLLEDRGPGVP